MNERIRELELQCFVYSDEMKTMRFDREKFAELLVRECADLVPGATLSAKILEHFGVK